MQQEKAWRTERTAASSSAQVVLELGRCKLEWKSIKACEIFGLRSLRKPVKLIKFQLGKFLLAGWAMSFAGAGGAAACWSSR